jgi:phosphatidylserine/phosphatidylglycerophosphate/cardiolipin synthase-like enzyme
MKSSAIVLLILGLGALGAWGVLVHNGVIHGSSVASLRAAVTPDATAEPGEGQYVVFYSPSHNLEREDAKVIRSARHSIDAALYSATDWELCGALADAARRGVKVRVYRDRDQFTEEAGRAHGRQTCVERLVGGGVEVKVKADRVLMHLKSYAVDGKLLRTGSANVSPSGEKQQDNDVVFLTSTAAARGFEAEFTTLWGRSDNEVVKAGS